MLQTSRLRLCRRLCVTQNAESPLHRGCVRVFQQLPPDSKTAPVFAGPGASNVIPNTVEMLGTIRALTHERFKDLRQRVTPLFNFNCVCWMYQFGRCSCR